MNVGSYVINENVPEWGAGKVLEKVGSNKLKIFFESVGVKTVITDMAHIKEVPEISYHPILDRLDKDSSFEGFFPFKDLEDNFLRKYPNGFDDPKYLEDERDYKIEASDLFHQILSQDIMNSMLNEEKYDEICDAARAIVNKTNLIFPNEKMSLSDGLKKGPEQREIFSKALFALLYGGSDLRERFESFITVLEELDAIKWTTSTYFLFLYKPDYFPFMKPKYYKIAAKAYAFDIEYSTRPNWDTYQRIIQFSEYVGNKLKKKKDSNLGIWSMFIVLSGALYRISRSIVGNF